MFLGLARIKRLGHPTRWEWGVLAFRLVLSSPNGFFGRPHVAVGVSRWSLSSVTFVFIWLYRGVRGKCIQVAKYQIYCTICGPTLVYCFFVGQ